MRSIGLTSCGFEEIAAFFFGEAVAGVDDRLPELVTGPGCGFADQGLEFCEYEDANAMGSREHLVEIDRVAIGGASLVAPLVRAADFAAPLVQHQWRRRARQEQEPRADVFQDGGSFGAAVGGEVARD